MEEKRKYIRIQAPIIVTYKIQDQSSESKKAVCKDFSEGGVRFPVYEQININTPLEIYIETPFDTLPIFVKGRVVWIKPLSSKEGHELYEMGVEFTEINPFDKKRLVQTARAFLGMKKGGSN